MEENDPILEETETEEPEHTCECCGEGFDDDAHSVKVRGPRGRIVEETWCDSCFDVRSFCCEDCSEDFSLNLQGYADLCEDCSEYYFICDDCGDRTHQDSRNYVEEDGVDYCDSCYPRHARSRHVQDYSYKPSPKFYGSPGTVHFGVELEVSGEQSTAEDTLMRLGDEHVYLKSDSSIQDGGYEIVSHPMTLDYHRTVWTERFFSNSRRDGLDAEPNGMHVHIQRRSSAARVHITPMAEALMDCFLSNNRGFTEFIADRNTSEWAECCAKKPTRELNSDRYVALNRMPCKTVEVRIFRGTLDRARFFANLEFCDALVSFCRDRSARELTPEHFCSFVRAHGRKNWRNLDALLVSGGYLPALPQTKQEKPSGRKTITKCA